jgi:hypothetical protein
VHDMKHSGFTCTTILCVAIAFSGCKRKGIHEFVAWPDPWPNGTNEFYAIEVEYGQSHVVLVPTVHEIQTNSRFIGGIGSWRYLEGYKRKSDGTLLTNRFWFVVDKKCNGIRRSLYVAMRPGDWTAWCNKHDAPTNLVDAYRFVAEAPWYNGGGPQL